VGHTHSIYCVTVSPPLIFNLQPGYGYYHSILYRRLLTGSNATFTLAPTCAHAYTPLRSDTAHLRATARCHYCHSGRIQFSIIYSTYPLVLPAANAHYTKFPLPYIRAPFLCVSVVITPHPFAWVYVPPAFMHYLKRLPGDGRFTLPHHTTPPRRSTPCLHARSHLPHTFLSPPHTHASTLHTCTRIPLPHTHARAHTHTYTAVALYYTLHTPTTHALHRATAVHTPHFCIYPRAHTPLPTTATHTHTPSPSFFTHTHRAHRYYAHTHTACLQRPPQLHTRALTPLLSCRDTPGYRRGSFSLNALTMLPTGVYTLFFWFLNTTCAPARDRHDYDLTYWRRLLPRCRTVM